MAAPVKSKFGALQGEAAARLADCRAQKNQIGNDLREGYYFTRPRLHRQIRSDTPPASNVEDDSEVMTGVGSEANEDFATELTAAYFPETSDWLALEAPPGLPEAAATQVRDLAKKVNSAVFSEIRASNFDAELGVALTPDAGIGTVALWIDQVAPYLPILVQHVPLRQLEINVGPNGDVDDRFAVRHFRYRQLPSVLPGIQLPEAIAKKVGDPKQNDKWCRVGWGFWRDWSVRGDEAWRSVIMVDDAVVDTKELRGPGCCPLIVFRISPDNIHAFGNGPTLSALPDLRVLDVLSEAQQNRALTSLDPPFAIPDDGVLNLEGGVQNGKAYPKRMGTKQDEFVPLFFEGAVDLGLFTIEDLTRRVRRRHFADYPEQTGKTPPTATQWLDEMAKSQRRIGTSGKRLFIEGPVRIHERFRYLGERRGTVPPLQVGGRNVSARARNPAIQAQAQQEVQLATRVMEILQAFFPEFMKTIPDPYKTAVAIKEKLGDTLIVFRTEDEAATEIKKLMEAMPQIAGAMQGQQPGAAPAGAPVA